MDFNSSDYFSYKKNKLQTRSLKDEKPLSRFNFLFQLFIATFIIIFIVIVVSIMKYSSKVDIEYSQGDIYRQQEGQEAASLEGDEEQGKIDKRLLIIQQEENAPSEAKIIVEEENHSQVIDPRHIEDSKKIDKIEKIKAQNEQSEAHKAELKDKIQNKKPQEETVPLPKNLTIISKVLVGRYLTFDEAQKMQAMIKEKDPSSTPFVRKTGDVYSVQMGSYQDFSTAKNQAQILKAKGLDVWIYQQ